MSLSRRLSLSITIGIQRRRLQLRKSKQETYLHILIKILAYIYFWEDDLIIEPNFRYNNYTPDLLRMDKPTNPKQVDKEIGAWVECKQVKLQKLDDLVRYTHGQIYWFHTRNHFRRGLTSGVFDKFKRIEEVKMVAISSDDIEGLLWSLKRGSDWFIADDMMLNQKLKIGLEDRFDPITVKFETVDENM